jgi:formamidopyrimidine-DNA glycosylase
MTGKLLLELPRSERPYERLRLTFDDGRHLHFIDTRRFGRLKIWPVAAIPGLGPEPLSFRTVQRILSGLQTRRPIKSVLLDQSVLAGIGNIYADEALHLAGIDPALPASALGPAALARLGRSIPRILNQAIRRQGTTLADYRTPANRRGRNQEHLRVYGREGQPCFVCGEGVQRRRIGGRSSYRCPRCQAGER